MSILNDGNIAANRYRDRELIQQRKDRNYELASKPVVPRLNNVLFAMMVVCAAVCALSEYFSAVKAQADGYEKFYSIGVSAYSAFIMWTAIGIAVLLCCVLEWHSYKRYEADYKEREAEWEKAEKKKASIPPELRRDADEVSRISAAKKEKKRREREIARAKIFACVTAIGAAALGIASVVLR